MFGIRIVAVQNPNFWIHFGSSIWTTTFFSAGIAIKIAFLSITPIELHEMQHSK